MNQVWLGISLIAQDLLAWTSALSLDDELANCEPKRLLHVAARITFHARKAILRLDQAWPWAAQLAAAFARLAALPPPHADQRSAITRRPTTPTAAGSPMPARRNTSAPGPGKTPQRRDPAPPRGR